MDVVASNKTECYMCLEETPTLYQCCPEKSDSACESCWSKMVDMQIQKGQLAPLFNGKMQCFGCKQPIDRSRLPESIQSKLNSILLTIPKTKNPQLIEEFHYAYDQSGELRHQLSNEKFVFLGQRHYNLLGGCIDTYIQTRMKSEPWNYREVWLPLRDEPSDDHHDQVNIFHSEDFSSNEKGCLILIQGSGVVRPGQWARSCCINESLDIGAMFPYMIKAKENNLSVIILNPNQTSYVEPEAPASDEENTEAQTDKEDEDILSFYLSSNPLPRRVSKKIPGLATNREHILYVYNEIIAKDCPAKNFYIVAHSAGGDSLMYLLRKQTAEVLAHPTKIAFTDSVHSTLPFESSEIKTFLRNNALHFVASDQPMGEAIDDRYMFAESPACPEVSAGHPKHEYTSGYCVRGVFDFFFPPEKSAGDGIETTAL